MLPRKFSAPGQLCSMAGHMPTATNPASGRKGSLCLNNPQYGFPCPTYNTQQWAQVGPLAPTAPPVGLQQGFLIPSGAHKSGNSCGSANLQTPQASWTGKAVPHEVDVRSSLSCPFTGRDSSDSLQRLVHVMWWNPFLGQMCTFIQRIGKIRLVESLFGYTA